RRHTISDRDWISDVCSSDLWPMASSSRPSAQNNLGSALRAKGRLDEAIGHYQEAVRLAPNYAEARHNLFLCQYAAASAAVGASRSEERRVGHERSAPRWAGE